MIAYTTLFLFLIGVFCCIKAGVKVDKIISWTALAAAFFVFLFFLNGMQSGNENVFSFIWNSSPSGDIKIDIISNAYNYNLVLPFFVITLLAITKNLSMHLEKQSGQYIAILLFNLVMVILMLTSNNFIQLLAALFITDILALFMVRDAMCGRRYVLLNILADMLLFMVVAIINSRIESLDIRQILRYNQIGFHLDFIAACGLTAVFIRFGFFIFHVGICALKEIPFHRFMNIIFLFSPLSALIILMKFHIVWQNSFLFTPYLNIICIFSIVWGGWRSFSSDSFKAKIIYGQMMFWALLTELLRFNGFVWNDDFTDMFLGIYVMMESFYLMYYYCARRKSILQIMTMGKFHFTGMLSSLLINFLAVFALADRLYRIYNRSNRYYIWLFAVLYIIAFSTTLRQIYRRPNVLKLPKMPLHFKSFVFVLLSGVLAFPLDGAEFKAFPVCAFTTVFMLMSCYSPFFRVTKLYANQWLQNADGFGFLYETIVESARLFGRILLLLVDRLFIERLVMKTMISVAQLNIRLFRKISGSVATVFFVIVLLTTLLWLSFNGGMQ